MFTATDDQSPHTAMEFECRLDPPPDPLPEPQDPDLEPPNPGEPPDIDTPPDGEGWVECASPISFRDLDEGAHHFEVRATDFADNKDLTPATHDWIVELRPGGGAAGRAARPRPGSPPARRASTTADSATFRFAGSDDMTPGPNLRFECRLDLGAWEACTTPKTYTGARPPTRTRSRCARSTARATPTRCRPR